VAFELTGGEAADSPMFEALIDAGPDEPPRAVVADKGYDSDANRAMARERGPYRSSLTGQTERPYRPASHEHSIVAAHASSR
jgi:hypothetical protein